MEHLHRPDSGGVEKLNGQEGAVETKEDAVDGNRRAQDGHHGTEKDGMVNISTKCCRNRDRESKLPKALRVRQT